MNCTRVPATAILVPVQAVDASNMDYRNLHHNHDNDAYVSPFAQNSPYSRGNAKRNERMENANPISFYFVRCNTNLIEYSHKFQHLVSNMMEPPNQLPIRLMLLMAVHQYCKPFRINNLHRQ